MRIVAAVAPRALSRPISPVRCVTDTSITFMTSMPATARLIAAMPATASVSAPSRRSKVASTASCVMTVTSSSPSWRSLMISVACALADSIVSRPVASIRMRKSVLLLNIACASDTGTKTISSVFIPSPCPLEASTPTMRNRRSPTRTSWPSAGSLPNNSLRTLAPITASLAPRRQSPVDRKRPCAMSSLRTAEYCAVVPAIITSRSRPPTLISEVPTASGATFFTAGALSSACASSTVRSRGVLVMAFPGLKPPVCERPGSTMTRLLPSDENSFIT